MSSEAEDRERTGIKKMLLAEGIDLDDKLIKEIIRVNLKFGKYHLLSEINDFSRKAIVVFEVYASILGRWYYSSRLILEGVANYGLQHSSIRI